MGEVDQNYSDNFGIEFAVEIKKVYVYKHMFFSLKFITKSTKVMLNNFFTQCVAVAKPTTKQKTAKNMNTSKPSDNILLWLGYKTNFQTKANFPFKNY